MHASVLLWKIVFSGQRIQHENSVYWLTCLRNTTYKVFAGSLSIEIANNSSDVSEVDAESFESWYSWFLSFLPPWFMIPTKIFFQIHDSRRLLITYWLINDFLSGHEVSFCKVSVSGVGTSVFIQTRDHHSFCPGMELFCIWTLSIRVTGETSGLSAPNPRII